MANGGLLRRLLVVPLASNDHGKSTLMHSLLDQAERQQHVRPQKGVRRLFTPWGREIVTLTFVRAYQETLAGQYGSVLKALDGEDSDWRHRDLVILPSHLNPAHCLEIIGAAHQGGFDVVAVSVVLADNEILQHAQCLDQGWDERWTLRNPRSEKWEPQVTALGRDLWTWIAAALARQ